VDRLERAHLVFADPFGTLEVINHDFACRILRSGGSPAERVETAARRASTSL
jgi:hypothetical protein